MTLEIDRVVLLTSLGKETRSLYASDEFRYEETPNGILMTHRKSKSLIPWHRVYEVQYARE